MTGGHHDFFYIDRKCIRHFIFVLFDDNIQASNLQLTKTR